MEERHSALLCQGVFIDVDFFIYPWKVYIPLSMCSIWCDRSNSLFQSYWILISAQIYDHLMQVLTHCAVSPPWWVPLFVLCNIHITILLSWVAAGPVSIPFILSRVVFLARCAVTSTVFCLYAVSVLGMENILAVSYYNNGKHLIWTWMLIKTLEPSRLGLGTRESPPIWTCCTFCIWLGATWL